MIPAGVIPLQEPENDDRILKISPKIQDPRTPIKKGRVPGNSFFISERSSIYYRSFDDGFVFFFCLSPEDKQTLPGFIFRQTRKLRTRHSHRVRLL